MRENRTVEHLHEGDLDFRSSLYLYEGRSGQAVRRLKYARSTSLKAFLAAEIARGIELGGWTRYTVVPVPIHWRRKCQRGFNQAEILCASTPHERALMRNRATRPQVGLDREQRLKNLSGAFTVVGDVSGKDILLVDDVVTSGQTARECARTLKAAGAAEVGIIAFCGEPNY
jgi:ComF family protein